VLLNKICLASDSEHVNIHLESLKLCYAVLGLCLLNEEGTSQSSSLKSLVPLLQVHYAHMLCRKF